jgi:DNA-directed RNA polymerase subunit RPC12/RpoP
MAHVKNYKCLSCQAPLAFDPTSQKWKCEYCFNTFTLEALEAAPSTTQVTEDLDVEQPELDAYNCQNCGAELIADGTTAATFCLYCKSPSVIKARFSGRFQPRQVIPFKITKKDAEGIYKSWIKKCLFAPDLFKSKESIEEITGIYAPFWMYDALMSGYIEGEGLTVSHWSTGDYNYTLTKYFKVVRDGQVGYDNVPIDASIKLDDELMHKIEPYDYSEMVPFNMQYMSGFMAERYDVEDETARGLMLHRVNNYVTAKFKSTVTQYGVFNQTQQNFNPVDVKVEYVLMPIYLLNNKYQGKDHVFVINGQTGKVVGQTPISKIKQAIFAASLFVSISALGILGGAFFG